MSPRKVRSTSFLLAGFVAFTVLMVLNAWVVDDAYITLRTVDNLVNGYGLRWNVAERVQSYTHPLWLAVLTPIYWLTREGFYTLITVAVAFSLAAVIVAARAVTDGFRASPWKIALLLVGLASCKAFLDYTTSGLENPLAYLVVAIAWVTCVRRPNKSANGQPAEIRRLMFFASLAFLIHPDLVLLFAPALFFAVVSEWPHWKKVGWQLAVGSWPATAWIAFSLLYYGFPLPNTVYAKALTTGLPIAWRFSRGVEYLSTGLGWDAVAFAAVAAAAVLAAVRRDLRAGLLLSGIILHMGFVVVTGASTTHMGSRLFAVSLFLGWLAFVDAVNSRRAALAAITVIVISQVVSPVAAFKFGTSAYQPVVTSSSSIDTKYYAYREGAALLNWRPGRQMPDHAWYHAGEAMRQSDERVHVGGAPGSDAIGFFGFAAGPRVFIIDRLGLTDPLLARLPAIRPGAANQWKSGHFSRVVPEGYVESVIANRSVISDEEVRRRYEALRIATRGPIFNVARFRQIAALNLTW